ncbi:hypothetical protein B0T14DRAFT_561732 [Immersiella caudata]|uniref:Uncharacterized protein n=1 Tax=Immersiella caudata TaxID=314043 RepID=A0AA39XHR1_9PEZI|nr:hypothetical protein B0T14DRAFT_561732 [Immersiella caudata]
MSLTTKSTATANGSDGDSGDDDDDDDDDDAHSKQCLGTGLTLPFCFEVLDINGNYLRVGWEDDPSHLATIIPSTVRAVTMWPGLGKGWQKAIAKTVRGLAEVAPGFLLNLSTINVGGYYTWEIEAAFRDLGMDEFSRATGLEIRALDQSKEEEEGEDIFNSTRTRSR